MCASSTEVHRTCIVVLSFIFTADMSCLFLRFSLIWYRCICDGNANIQGKVNLEIRNGPAIYICCGALERSFIIDNSPRSKSQHYNGGHSNIWSTRPNAVCMSFALQSVSCPSQDTHCVVALVEFQITSWLEHSSQLSHEQLCESAREYMAAISLRWMKPFFFRRKEC
jgi:hypothetical protein